jgi:hypothetical protein
MINMKTESHITRDLIITRIDELRAAGADLDTGHEDTRAEFEALVSFEAECEQYCSDWQYGDAVMSEAATREYLLDTIKECYELPATLTSGQWPYRHITIDYEAAIDEAMSDYTAIELEGVTFYCR